MRHVLNPSPMSFGALCGQGRRAHSSVLTLPHFLAAMAEQPKKPAGGAFGCWLAEHRAELQKEVGPGKPASEVAKLAGARYKTLSEDTKAVYQKMFEAAKAKYEADMAAFLEAGGEKKSTKRKAEKSSKRKKDPAAPKKPAGGAFGCFLSKNRAAFTEECKGQPVTAITKLASDRWKALGEDEKKIYQADYEAKKAEYEEAMKSYVPLPSADDEADKPATNPQAACVFSFCVVPLLCASDEKSEVSIFQAFTLNRNPQTSMKFYQYARV